MLFSLNSICNVFVLFPMDLIRLKFYFPFFIKTLEYVFIELSANYRERDVCSFELYFQNSKMYLSKRS
jgi:hypothetical protein